MQTHMGNQVSYKQDVSDTSRSSSSVTCQHSCTASRISGNVPVESCTLRVHYVAVPEPSRDSELGQGHQLHKDLMLQLTCLTCVPSSERSCGNKSCRNSCINESYHNAIKYGLLQQQIIRFFWIAGDSDYLQKQASMHEIHRWSLSGSSQAYLSYDWCKVFPSPFKVIGSEKFRAHAQ
ncbi:hypothetical protein Anapl_02802 [Anas platyrhynchos]|uniref:Uncharacterized protein n=1 Tax=Anas platyrhynchos TaxID=8839 RepID=R0LVX8_ANAPL|nr:hypothetical protein Anapl_02802 [Anas platyrhynchos]